MKTEIKDVEVEHFDWIVEEEKNDKGKVINKRVVKRILTPATIIKKRLITYDDNGIEIKREPVTVKEQTDLSNIDINSLTDEQIQTLKKRLGL